MRGWPWRPARWVGLALAIALLGGCVAPGATSPRGSLPSPAPGASTASGGTVRIVVPVSSPGGVDPSNPLFLDAQQDFSVGTNELIRCCLGRTLYSYNGLPTEQGGGHLEPDLAEAAATVSPDGLTWTVRIRPGIRYAPPLQGVEIVAADFVRAFHRLMAPACPEGDDGSTTPCLPVQGMAYSFDLVQGVEAYNEGKAASISGIEAPDARTLVFRLTDPAGDFGAMLALAFVAPLPANPIAPDAPFGVATGAGQGYGRTLVSSGPYMIEGADRLDFSVPASERPAPAGLTASTVTLVRNPSWDASTDVLRPARADRIEIAMASNMTNAVAALDGGTADVVWAPQLGMVDPTLYAAFQSNPRRGRALVNAVSLVRNVVFNVAVPPFDDIHVRKAVAWALDRQGMVDALGGPSVAGVIGHLAPDAGEDGLLLNYDPYASPGSHGNLAAAKAEMRLSKYDTNGDGVCDAAACAGIDAVTREPFGGASRTAADSLRPLGLDLRVTVMEKMAFLDDAGHPRVHHAVYVGLTWTSGYLTASGTMEIFYAPWQIAADQDPPLANTSLVGAKPADLKAWGYTVTETPNVDDRIAACIPVVGSPGVQCWASLDQYLMEHLVAIIPFEQDRAVTLASPGVVAYGFDELVGTVALDRLAVAP